jgi:hypothetical protein
VWSISNCLDFISTVINAIEYCLLIGHLCIFAEMSIQIFCLFLFVFIIIIIIFFVVLGLAFRALTLSHSTKPFCDRYFWDRVSQTSCLSLLQTEILLISSFWLARIIGVSHRHLVCVYYWILKILCVFWIQVPC